jgi:hypothetical protein
MPPLQFGIYAGGRGAAADGSITVGPPDEPAAVRVALDQLDQAGRRAFLVRAYQWYTDAGVRWTVPDTPEQYLTGARRLDLVVCFREPGRDLRGWRSYLCQVVDRFGDRLAKLQVAEKPNHAGPGGDGAMPAVRAAVVEGLVAASQHIRATGSSIQVGCNSTLIAPHADDHWSELVRLGGGDFIAGLGYVGLDFFPDLVRRIAPDRLQPMVQGVLRDFG